MTVSSQENPAVEVKIDDKERNFRQLEARYEKELAKEREARLDAEKRAQEILQKRVVEEDDDGEDEPYVDHKRLNRKLNTFERKLEEKIDKRAEEKARVLIEQDKQQNWMKSNPDFYDIMQHAQRFAETDPDLAETILTMPDTFERQKLVYKTIKSMGLHKPASKEPSIQEKINANRRSPYYQPSQVGSAPYAMAGDFSTAGQKNAYDKMQELKKNLRI